MTYTHDDPWMMLSPSRGHEKRPAADWLHIEAIENVRPLDRQFGMSQRRKFVPDALNDILFGELSPTEVEIAAAGGDTAAVPPLQTYAIIDAAKVINLAELLESSQLEHRCLFKGTTYDEMKNVAPWIVRLTENNDFCRRLFTGAEGINGLWKAEPGIYVRSRGTFDELWRHFRKFTRVQGTDGKFYFFRYWNHHVFLAWMMESRKTMTIARSFLEDGSKLSLRTMLAYDALGGAAWQITPDYSLLPPGPRTAIKLTGEEESIFRRSIVRPLAVEIVLYLRKEHADLCSDYSLVDLHSAVEISLMRLHDYGFLRSDILTELVIQDLYLGYPFEDDDKTGEMRQICRSESPQEIRYQQLCEMIANAAGFEHVDGGIL